MFLFFVQKIVSIFWTDINIKFTEPHTEMYTELYTEMHTELYPKSQTKY